MLFTIPSIAPIRPVEATLVLNPELIPICTCESSQGTGMPQHYDIETGNVLHGEINNKDIGICQINEYWNGVEATELGFDIYTEYGNISMANYMYERQGTTPWNPSISCWGPKK